MTTQILPGSFTGLPPPRPWTCPACQSRFDNRPEDQRSPACGKRAARRLNRTRRVTGPDETLEDTLARVRERNAAEDLRVKLAAGAAEKQARENALKEAVAAAHEPVLHDMLPRTSAETRRLNQTRREKNIAFRKQEARDRDLKSFESLMKQVPKGRPET